MTKTNDAKRKAGTHFELVPLEAVKKIAEQDVPKNRKETDHLDVKPTSRRKV